MAERTSLSTYRFVFAMLAAFLIQVGALPMVAYFGQGDDARGYQLTMAIFSALAVVLFVFITLAMRGGVMYYYFRYYLSSEGLAEFTRGVPAFLGFFVRLSGGA